MKMKIFSLNLGVPREVKWTGGEVRTGIYKQPVQGRVNLRRLNLDRSEEHTSELQSQ